MLTDRRDRRRLKTEKAIARAAMRLFGRDGFEAVTMELIAADADIAKGTLYNHFPTKEAVLAHAIHEQLGEDLAPMMKRIASETGFEAGVTPVMDALAGWCKAHREYLAPYLRFRFMELQGTEPVKGTNYASDIVDVYALLIGNSQAAGELRRDVDARHLAVLFHHLCLGALLRWLQDKELKLRRELEMVVELFVDGAATHKREKKS